MIKRDIQQLLKELNIIPKKSKGQNFLIDSNVLKKILSISDISDKDIILEIGPGLGALTGDLIKRAKKVIAVEIEPEFCSFLSNRYLNYDNLEIINGDILKIDLPVHNKVIANIPYSITGPILEKIFFKNKPPQGVLTIEESLAKRLFALQNYKLKSRISLSVNSFLKPEKMFTISPQCFYPNPKINLAIIKIQPKSDIDPFLIEEESRNFYLRFIAGIMPYKNKNIANALELFLNKNLKINNYQNEIQKILEGNNIKKRKTFTLAINEIIELCKSFYYFKNNLNDGCEYH